MFLLTLLDISTYILLSFFPDVAWKVHYILGANPWMLKFRGRVLYVPTKPILWYLSKTTTSKGLTGLFDQTSGLKRTHRYQTIQQMLLRARERNRFLCIVMRPQFRLLWNEKRIIQDYTSNDTTKLILFFSPPFCFNSGCSVAILCVLHFFTMKVMKC